MRIDWEKSAEQIREFLGSHRSSPGVAYWLALCLLIEFMLADHLNTKQIIAAILLCVLTYSLADQ